MEDTIFFPTAGLESNMKILIICGFLIHILLLYLKTSASTKWLLLKTKLLCVTTISGFLLQAGKSDSVSVNLEMYWKYLNKSKSLKLRFEKNKGHSPFHESSSVCDLQGKNGHGIWTILYVQKWSERFLNFVMYLHWNKIGSFIQAFIAENTITGIFLIHNFTRLPKVLTALH